MFVCLFVWKNKPAYLNMTTKIDNLQYSRVTVSYVPLLDVIIPVITGPPLVHKSKSRPKSAVVYGLIGVPPIESIG